MKKFFLVAFIFLFQQVIINAQTATELYNEGLALKKERKVEAAADKFKKAFAMDPNNYIAQYELGWCYNDLKLYTKAVNELSAACKNLPNVPKCYFEKGFAYYNLEKFDSSLSAFSECKNLKQDYKNLYKYIGYCYYSTDKYENAKTNFNQHITLLGITETHYLFWYRKGFVENALKNYDLAIVDLEKSLAYKKDYLNTYLELGFANTKLKKNTTAINYFKKAISIDRKSHIPYNGIAEVYRDNYKNMDSAMYWYRETLKINSKERKGNFGLGYCLNSKNNYADAMPYLKTAVEQEPSYTAAWVELGYSNFKIGKQDAAFQCFDKALSLNNKNENARFYKGLLFIEQKNKTKAQQMVDELKALGSKNATLLQDKVNQM